MSINYEKLANEISRLRELNNRKKQDETELSLVNMEKRIRILEKSFCLYKYNQIKIVFNTVQEKLKSDINIGLNVDVVIEGHGRQGSFFIEATEKRVRYFKQFVCWEIKNDEDYLCKLNWKGDKDSHEVYCEDRVALENTIWSVIKKLDMD